MQPHNKHKKHRCQAFGDECREEDRGQREPFFWEFGGEDGRKKVGFGVWVFL